MKKQNYFWLLTFLMINIFNVEGQIFKTVEGHATFRSDAPLELIQAESNQLKGAIDTQKRTFAFTVRIQSFEGFNSPLQREHFNENYMESQNFPHATFSGKIIEKIDLSSDGDHIIRAKGKLIIHGVQQERIIKSTLEIKDGRLIVKSSFSVLLEEHEIRIPKIVHQKIAKEIIVNIEAELLP